MKINQSILLAVLLVAGSCQSTASSQRSVSVVGLVPMSGTTETVGADDADVERSGAGVRLENRDGAIGLGVEIRQATYSDPGDPTADEDGIELAGFFRRYLEDSDNSAFIEASPILGLGIEGDGSNETSSYALLRVAAGYRWMLAEDIFIDVDTGYYMTLMSMDVDVVPVSSKERNGIDVGLAIGFNF